MVFRSTSRLTQYIRMVLHFFAVLIFVFFISFYSYGSQDFGGWTAWTKITFSGYTTHAPLTNFTTLVILNETVPGFKYNELPDPPSVDLRFKSFDTTTELNYEIEKWNTNGDSYVWVQVPEIADTNSAIWIAWGSTNTVAPSYTINGSTWSNGFIAVWHMNETSGTRYDSTPNGKDGLLFDNPSVGTGIVAGGLSLDGNDGIDIPNDFGQFSSSPLSISMWINPTPATVAGGNPVAFSGGAENNLILTFGDGAENNSLSSRINDGGWWNPVKAPNIPASSWTYVTFTFDPSAGYVMYKNGVKSTSNPATAARGTRTGDNSIGCLDGNQRFYAGLMDEVRVSAAARSSNWVWASWACMNDNSNFVSYSQLTLANAAASNVTATTAFMNGHLFETDAVPFSAWVYYGQSDGGTNETAWDTTNFLGQVSEGLLSTNITGLTPNSEYFYRYCVSNTLRKVWAEYPTVFINGAITLEASDPNASESGPDTGTFSVYRPPLLTNGALSVNYEIGGTALNGVDYEALSGSVIIPSGQTNAYISITPFKDMAIDPDDTVTITLVDGEYLIASPSNDTVNIIDANVIGSHRIRFTFSGYAYDKIITNIPIAVVLNETVPGFHYDDFPDPPVMNLRFADSNLSTELVYDIEEWNTSGDSIIWVNVPELVKSNTVIWACWGITNTTIPEYTANGGLWDENYVGIWHLADVNDSSSNGINGVNSGTYNSSGVIGKCRTFDGSSYINITDPVLNIRNQITMEAWVRRDAGTSWAFALGAGDGGWSYDFGISSGNKWGLEFAAPNGKLTEGPAVVSGEWHHLAFTYDNIGREILYLDGIQVATNSDVGLIRSSTLFMIGAKNDLGIKWNGLIDEIRISDVAHSSNDVWATWATTVDHTNFFSTTGFVTDNPASNVTATTADMNGHLWATDSVTTYVWLYYGETDACSDKNAWDGTNFFGQVPVGPLSTNITGLNTDTTYFYRYYVSNSLWEAWAPEQIVFINGSITLYATDTSGVEGTRDNAVFTVYRPTTITNSDLTVYYSLSGSALNGSDYAGLSGSIVMPAGQTNVDLVIAPLEDLVTDPGENVTVTIQPGGYLIGSPSNGTVNIADVNTVANNWTNKFKIIFPGYTSTNKLTNFPALVVLNENVPGFSYNSMAFTNGADLRFMNSNETAFLAYEIEDWNTNGNSYIWVRVPEMKANGPGMWCWWGNTNAAFPGYITNGTTWSEGYAAVLHLNETVPDEDVGSVHTNSVNNGFNGTQFGNARVPGIVGGAQDMDANDWINVPDWTSTADTYSLSFWISPDARGSWHPRIGANTAWGSFNLHGAGDGTIYVGTGAGGGQRFITPSGTMPLYTWQHYTFTFNNQQARFYKDGILINTSSNMANAWLPWNGFAIGNASSDARFDETRVSDFERSSNWVWATWATMADQSNFTAYLPIIDVSSPSNITADSATLNGVLWATDSVPSYVWVYYGENDQGMTESGWDRTNFMGQRSVGVLSTNVTALNTDSSYFYRFYVSNSMRQVWTENAAIFVNGAISMEVTDAEAYEEGSDSATFSIWRPNSLTNGDLIVNIGATGSAIDGIDYTNIPHSVVIPSGSSNVTVSIFPIDDALIEADEYVILRITGGSYIVGLSSNKTATIIDNDKPSSFLYRMKISFPEYSGATLVNFPVLVIFNESIEDFKYSTFSSVNGYDLRFLNAEQNMFLNYEVEQWDISSNSYIWVQVPAMTNGAFIYACWHNPNKTVASKYMELGAAWNSDYRGVWHLNDYMTDESTAGGHLDSTGNGWLGLQRGNDDTTNAIIIRGQTFDGIDDRIEMADVFSGNAYTKEIWVRVTKDVTQSQNLMSGDGDNHALWINGTHLRSGHNNTWTHVSEEATVFPTSVWQHVALTYDKDYNEGFMILYRNGVRVDQAAFVPAPNWGTPKTYIGAHGGGTVLGGEADEARLSSVARSDNWIWASYKNQRPGSTFVSYGQAKNRGTVFMLR